MIITEWQFRYVSEGQLEPDEYGRWALDCYVFIHLDALPQYEWSRESWGEWVRTRFATIHQKGTKPGIVPSTIDRFSVCLPDLSDAGNTGLSTQSYFYSNDLEELKKVTEEKINRLFKCFYNLKAK